MATLMLSAVGSAIAGPIGAAVGAIIGQQIDQRIFAPKARSGPRLGDLTVQTSTYGSDIPKLFGTMRVAGTVIWATDLRENRTRQSNGKGRAKSDVFSYSASFAVALSGRPITAIGRIWADGKLLLGAAGDLKVEAVLRVHLGAEGQALDPLIAAAEGLGTTPGYRGCAYVVIEDLQLGDYGNRIPQLSFEVIADAEPVRAGDVIASLSGGDVASDGGPLLDGFAASGDALRSVVEALAAALPVSCVDTGSGLVARFGAGAAVAIAADDYGAAEEGKTGERMVLDRKPPAVVPTVVSIGYYETARDYQPSIQRARRSGSGRREARIELAAAVSADAAKAIAENRLSDMLVERTMASVTLPMRALAVAPGDAMVLAGLGGSWRVRTVAFERMVVKLGLVRTRGASIAAIPADPGRPVTQGDLVHGPTTILLLDLPQMSDVPVAEPVVVVAANGVSAGWRRAALLASLDGGTSYEAAGGTALPAVMGRSVGALGSGSAGLIDRINSVEVRLINGALELADADTGALLAGANVALLGEELIQFGQALSLGGGVYRLSELWRARRGTEAAAHIADEAFVLIEEASLAAVASDKARGGLTVMVTGIGDGSGGAVAVLASAGRAVRPLAPVHLRAAAVAGDVVLSWVRRSRDGYRWANGIDAGVAEERELYRVTKTVAGAARVPVEVTLPGYVYTAAARAADSGFAASVTFAVQQIGTAGVSPSAVITISTS